MNLVELINGLHFKWNLSFICVTDISFVPFTAAFTKNIGLWAIDLHKQVVDKVYIPSKVTKTYAMCFPQCLIIFNMTCKLNFILALTVSLNNDLINFDFI